MTPQALMKAAEHRKSVTLRSAIGQSVMPAAFVVCMPFNRVMHFLPRMTIYKPRKDKFTKSPWTRKQP